MAQVMEELVFLLGLNADWKTVLWKRPYTRFFSFNANFQIS